MKFYVVLEFYSIAQKKREIKRDIHNINQNI